MPLRKMDFIKRLLALAEPVPLTEAILITRSLLREDDMFRLILTADFPQTHSGNLRLFRLRGVRLVSHLGPMDKGLLHIPRGRRTALGAQSAVNTQVLVL